MSVPQEKLAAEWFWTDRWSESTAFHLPLEARGLYREMLTQAWRRGAQLPLSLDSIQRIVGSTDKEWKRSWPLIKPYWHEQDGALVNDTQVQVYAEAKRRSERASARGRAGAQALHKQVLEQVPERVLKQVAKR